MMVVGGVQLVVVITSCIMHSNAFIRKPDKEGWDIQGLNAILQASSQEEYFITLITKAGSLVDDGLEKVQAQLGVGMFEVATNGKETNVTEAQISRVINYALELRKRSWFVTVMVVSDDPAFLTTTTEWSLKGRLLVWSTRLLVLTRLPLHRLHHLRNTLAMTNSMLIHSSESSLRVYVEMPFSATDSPLLQVALWTRRRGLVSVSRFEMFPDKFYILSSGPTLRLGYVEFPTTKKEVVEDPTAPGGKRVVILDPEVTIMTAISQLMNFTISHRMPADRGWGVKLASGKWTGMIGMVTRKEIDLSQSLFHLTAQRSEELDYTVPVTVWYTRTIVRRGSPEVDPWGFLLPLTPLVWLAILAVLLGVLKVAALLHYCQPATALRRTTRIQNNAANFIRVLLHQDLGVERQWWWWERVMLGVWMLMVLVLTQSYAGTLMSLLAVRYIPLPIQSLQDIIDKPVTLILPRGTSTAYAFLSAERGILKEVADLHYEGRLMNVPITEFVAKQNTLGRQGTHVLMAIDSRTPIMIAQDFSKTGRCDFYQAREEILPMPAGFTGPRGSPLVPALSRRVLRIVESGIYYHLYQLYNDNLTNCLNPPKKVVARTSLGVNNVWGTLVVLAVGGLVSLLALAMELLYFNVLV